MDLMDYYDYICVVSVTSSGQNYNINVFLFDYIYHFYDLILLGILIQLLTFGNNR